MSTLKEDKKSVVANIIKIRTEKKMGQTEVAQSLGISTATYSRIESESVALTYENLAKIANAFSMRVIDVITYPYIYSNKKNSSTKVIIELDVTPDEFVSMGLKDRVIKVLNKGDLHDD